MENQNTVNEQVAEQTSTEEIKTFTKDEVNRIVQERLIKDRKDRADYDVLKEKAEKFDALEEASKTELQKATERAEKLEAELSAMRRTNEIEAIRREVESETSVPASLLSGESKEACLEQAKNILAFYESKKNGSGYPTLKDGGEPSGNPKGSTQQQFSEWLANNF